MEVYYTDEVGKLSYPNGVSNEGTGAGLIQDVSHKEAVGDSLFLPIVRIRARISCPKAAWIKCGG
jgi:hypothetical protein